MVVRAASPDVLAHAANPRAPDQSDQDADQSLYLIGRPPLKDFLRFAKHQAIKPPRTSALTDAWQSAQAVIRRLEVENRCRR